MKEKKDVFEQGAIRDARTLGLPRMLILGLQHMFAMFGATVLVPIIVQNQYDLPLNTQTTLFFAGLGTLLFHVCTKMKVPAFLGSSFAFLGGFAAMGAMDSGMYAGMDPAVKLQYACGGIVVAGLLYVVMAAIIKLVGVRKVMRFLPPVVTGPIIILIGLNLAPSAVSNASTCWWLAIVAIAVIIVANLWGKGMIKIIPILLGVVGSYLVAAVAGQVDFTAVKNAAWIGLPFAMEDTVFSFFKTGVNGQLLLEAIIAMMPISLATMMEHIGDMSAISSTVGKNYIENPGLHRSLMGDGCATALAALFGAPANTTYGENTGVLALTKVYNPAVVRLAAVLAILFSFCPKFAALIYCMPTATIGGVSLILYGMISAVGVRNVVENQVDFTKSRNVLIAALILVIAIGMKYGTGDIGGITFQLGSVNIQLSSLAIAAIVGIVMNAILPGKDYEFGANEQGDISVNFGSRHK